MPSALDQLEKAHDPLPALRAQLFKEFGGTVPRDQIDEIADQAIKSFGDVKVHAFLPVLAFRRARGFLIRSLRAGDDAASTSQAAVQPTQA